MTQEQYEKVIFLDKRLKELEQVYNLLCDKYMHLSYFKEGHFGHKDELCNLEDLLPIKEILVKYENIICLEVKGEIESIKKQISEI